jgi:hypothetical protein
MLKRYSKLDFKPPSSVRKAAKRGLELRKKFGRGGLSTKVAGKLGIGSGIARANNLVRGKVSPGTVKRMHNYFSRHGKDKRKGWSSPNNPSNGYIAWLLWGGDAGKRWADGLVKRMKKIEDKKKRR